VETRRPRPRLRRPRRVRQQVHPAQLPAVGQQASRPARRRRIRRDGAGDVAPSPVMNGFSPHGLREYALLAAGGRGAPSGPPAGGRHALLLETSDRRLPDPVDAGHLWQATEHAWHMAVPELANTVAPRDARHAYAVLRGLTTGEGGMVAAATLGLPERLEAG